MWAQVTVWAGATTLTALVGLSRVYLGVHWMTDVIGGWTFGVLWLAVGQGAVDPVRELTVLGELQAGHALGDHGPDPRVGAEGRDGLLTAHRQAEHGDLAGLHPGLAGQVRHGRSDVTVAPPAEVHGMPGEGPYGRDAGVSVQPA